MLETVKKTIQDKFNSDKNFYQFYWEHVFMVQDQNLKEEFKNIHIDSKLNVMNVLRSISEIYEGLSNIC